MNCLTLAMARVASLLLVCLVLVGINNAVELSCTPSNSSEIKVTFDSHRNRTGQWTHSIGLENQDLPQDTKQSHNTVSWSVDVKYIPNNCDDKRKDSVKVMIAFSAASRYATDYLFIRGLGYYKYYSTPAPWAVAQATCEQDGAHLAILNSPQEADSLKKLIVNTNKDWAWIGLVKSNPKGEFVTVMGDPLSKTGFNQWFSGFIPENAPNNSAAVLHKTVGTMAYDTTPDNTYNLFICEQG